MAKKFTLKSYPTEYVSCSANNHHWLPTGERWTESRYPTATIYQQQCESCNGIRDVFLDERTGTLVRGYRYHMESDYYLDKGRTGGIKFTLADKRKEYYGRLK